jgi:hypothetical protein
MTQQQQQINKITLWCRHFLEKLIIGQLTKEFHFYRIQSFISPSVRTQNINNYYSNVNKNYINTDIFLMYNIRDPRTVECKVQTIFIWTLDT